MVHFLKLWIQKSLYRHTYSQSNGSPGGRKWTGKGRQSYLSCVFIWKSCVHYWKRTFKRKSRTREAGFTSREHPRLGSWAHNPRQMGQARWKEERNFPPFTGSFLWLRRALGWLFGLLYPLVSQSLQPLRHSSVPGCRWKYSARNN